MIIPILVVLLLNDIEHGDDVHRPQHPVPVVLVHVTDIAVVFSIIIHITNSSNSSMRIILDDDNDGDG